MHEFSAGSSFLSGWETFKKRPWFLVGATLLFVVVLGVVSYLLMKVGTVSLVIGVIAFVVRVVFELFAVMGLLAFSLKAHDNIEDVSLAEFWHPQDFWKFLGSIVVQVLLLIAGFIALVIPGVMLSVALKLSPYFVIDKHEGPIESLFSSVRITRGKKWALFQFLILSLVVNVAGFFVFFVGFLVTLPVTLLATVHAYRTLSRAA